MATEQKDRAVATAASLYPRHLDIVEEAATYLGLEGNTFSPALQFIITDWKRLREQARADAPAPTLEPATAAA